MSVPMSCLTSRVGALLALWAGQVGTAGVVLRTDQVDVLRQTWVLIQQLAAAKAAPALQLGRAVVTRVAPMGMGERVCVDCTSLMWPGEGLLCGNFARALFLVHSECAETSYIAARPFRVNAGAVHGYVLAPEGRTAYLAELSCGSQVLVADPAGRTRSVTVGRSKLERRPLILVEAQLADGDLVSVLLQNAETVRLVGSQSEQPGGRTQVAGTALPSIDGLYSRDADTEVGSVDAPELSAQWRAVPVTQLQVGHTLLVHQPSAGARHMGLPVEEFMLEK
ncbi:3-dehydroquinate synthase-domain-containing protein [Haematococcus lacustris]